MASSTRHASDSIPTLTFSRVPNAAGEAAAFAATRIDPTLAQWEALAGNIGADPGLSPYQAATLRDRWIQGRAAIAWAEEAIVSFVSLIPILDPAAIKRLHRAVGGSPIEPTGVELYESATGWTHPDWRGQGLSLRLRRELLAGFERPDRLFVSATIGLGASNVTPRLGWRLHSWDAIPFASALMGFTLDGLGRPPTATPRQPPGLSPYLGPHITPRDHPDHPWKDHCHLWISDVLLAESLDRRLAELMGGDVKRWRGVVAEEIHAKPPEPAWKPFLFRERLADMGPGQN